MDAHLARSALILNQSTCQCSSAQCESVAQLLRESCAFSDIYERKISLPPVIKDESFGRFSFVPRFQRGKEENFPLVPDLVLVRTSLCRITKNLIDRCREKWNQAFLFALVCPERHPNPEDLTLLISGVDDFLSCPFQRAELWLRIQRLFQSKGSTKEAPPAAPPKERLQLESIVGESDIFIRAINKIGPLARAKAPVLISGETGTGKELFARAIHYQGPRKGKPFIPVNCGALPDHLFENELFGHTRGAFTDASTAQKGLIAEAEGGTLFLDEVDALSPSAQVKLLRFLQDGEYRPLGASRSVKSDVRVIAATNAELKAQVDSKLFREDLYYRLNVLSLAIPPLRDRAGDIPLLSVYFLDRYSTQQGQEPARLSTAALEKLMSYSWPGNVRELEAVIQRTLVLNSLAILEPEDIDIPSLAIAEFSLANGLREAKSTAVGDFERGYLVKLMAIHHGNVSHAAKAAGKDRRTFQRLLRRYNIDRRSFQ